jgi:GNAT superfamily N-acetyltransferase
VDDDLGHRYANRLPLPLPGGVVARVATRQDVDPIVALVATCEAANDGVSEVHPTDIIQAFDLASTGDDILVVQGPGGIVAWATLVDGRADVNVHPDARGQGIGAALLAWTERQARIAGRTQVRQVVTDADVAAHRLFEESGYTEIQTTWILEIELGEAAPTVHVPPGIVLRAYEPGDEQEVYQVIEDAFSEAPGRDPVSFERWAAHVRDHPAFAPGLSRLAFDGAELVGVALSLDYAGESEGWVQQLATKATHRHRGIARALLGSVFAVIHATGKRTVGLSTNSRTGALSLYERLGMRVRRSYTGWSRDLN